MKRATEKKVQTLASNENKPDDEKVNCKPLSTIDEIVLDIIGNGRVRYFFLNLILLMMCLHIKAWQFIKVNISLISN